MRKFLFILIGTAAVASAHAGKPHAPVRIQSQTPHALRANQTGEIVVTVTPMDTLDTLQVIFHGEDGLTVQSGQSQTATAPPAGVPLVYRLTVSGAHEGLFHLTAIAAAQIAGHACSRVVSLEVPVGDPAQLRKARVLPLTQIDSTGQRIRSMPAQEQR